jgi:hypothetical protein
VGVLEALQAREAITITNRTITIILNGLFTFYLL